MQDVYQGVTQKPRQSQPLADEWVEQFDTNYSRAYWWNPATGVSSWTRPVAPVDRPVVPTIEEPRLPCGVCSVRFPVSEMYTADCDHRFCYEHMREHARREIRNGRRVRCPSGSAPPQARPSSSATASPTTSGDGGGSAAPAPPAAASALPYGGDEQAAMRAQDRDAIRQIMAARNALAQPAPAPANQPPARAAPSMEHWDGGPPSERAARCTHELTHTEVKQLFEVISPALVDQHMRILSDQYRPAAPTATCDVCQTPDLPISEMYTVDCSQSHRLAPR